MRLDERPVMVNTHVTVHDMMHRTVLDSAPQLGGFTAEIDDFF